MGMGGKMHYCIIVNYVILRFYFAQVQKFSKIHKNDKKISWPKQNIKIFCAKFQRYA
jgi:hypothetical protein